MLAGSTTPAGDLACRAATSHAVRARATRAFARHASTSHATRNGGFAAGPVRRHSKFWGERCSPAWRRSMTMRSAVAFPDDAVESADSDEENDDKPPKILRFNGDKISLHKTNGNGNGRRAASGGASEIAPNRPPEPPTSARANPDQKKISREGRNFPESPPPIALLNPPLS